MEAFSWSAAATVIGVVATIGATLLKIFSMKKENGNKEIQRIRERLIKLETDNLDDKKEIEHLRGNIEKLYDLLIKLMK